MKTKYIKHPTFKQLVSFYKNNESSNTKLCLMLARQALKAKANLRKLALKRAEIERRGQYVELPDSFFE